MTLRMYKELSCRKVGIDCDFLVRSESEEEAISVVSEHACRSHNICEITPELKAKMQSASKSVGANVPWLPERTDSKRRVR